MARVNNKTRLSPPLMYVFRAAHDAKDAKKRVDIRSEGGDRVIASRRMRVRQVISESVLRREVTRDLDALLNTIALEATIDMREAEYVRKSILNFGLPDVTHRTIDEIGVDDISEEIRATIIKYEPRLATASVRVERDMSVDPAELKIRFNVRADLTCDPVNVPVEFTADIIDGGKILINRL